MIICLHCSTLQLTAPEFLDLRQVMQAKGVWTARQVCRKCWNWMELEYTGRATKYIPTETERTQLQAVRRMEMARWN